MDAVKYLKEKARMVKVSSNGSCCIFCEDCGLSYSKNGRKLAAGVLKNYIQKKLFLL